MGNLPFFLYLKQNPEFGFITAMTGWIFTQIDAINPICQNLALIFGLLIAIVTFILKGIQLYEKIEKRIKKRKRAKRILKLKNKKL